MKVLYKEQIKEIELQSQKGGFSSLRMMENAGSFAANVINEKYLVNSKNVLILAGCGNNGGDGFVVARKLYESGANVTILLVSGLPKTESAKEMLAKISHYNICVIDNSDKQYIQKIETADLIIDAIFGIGFKGETEGFIAECINIANNSTAINIALDLPSGVECDTGKVSKITFEADTTISFIAVKPCHILEPSIDYCGSIINSTIGVTKKVFEEQASDITVIDANIVNSLFHKRKLSAHKGDCGTAAFLCGSYGMAGALILSVKAALRSGVGIAKAIVNKSIYPILTSTVPEAVCVPMDDSKNLCLNENAGHYVISNQSNFNALLIGSGLGVNNDTRKLVFGVLPSLKIPTVIDADGINIISENIDILAKSKNKFILTPHPKEFARLLNLPVKDVLQNRFKLAKTFAVKTGNVLVLKGANTLIALPDGNMYVSMYGNCGMATGGSGDVLAGIITSLLAQGYSLSSATILGVYIHGVSGDIALSKQSIHSLLPSDIIDNLFETFRELE